MFKKKKKKRYPRPAVLIRETRATTQQTMGIQLLLLSSPLFFILLKAKLGKFGSLPLEFSKPIIIFFFPSVSFTPVGKENFNDDTQ